MSVFHCDLCEQYIDGDHQGCLESPLSDTGNICEPCFESYYVDCEHCDKAVYEPKAYYEETPYNLPGRYFCNEACAYQYNSDRYDEFLERQFHEFHSA